MNVPSMCVLMTLLGAPAVLPGQTRDDNWNRCNGSDPDMAIAGCTAIIQQDLENGADWSTAQTYVVFNIRGIAYGKKREYDQAIQDFDQALRLSPNDTTVFNNRGNAYYAKGDFDQAIKDYSEAIRLRPDFALAFNNRGDAYMRRHEYERAVEDFGEALRFARESYATVGGDDSAPFNSATALSSRGIAYIHIGDYDHAIKDLDEAIRLKPDDADAYYSRGVAHNSRSEFDSAIADYDKSIRIDPGNAFAFYYRGIAKRNKGDVAGARDDIAAALQIDPEIAGKVGEMTVPLTPVTTNLPQSRSVSSCEALRDGGHPVAQVPSYVDAPIGVLKMMVPGLSGIGIDMVENASDGTPAMPTQDMTASILNRTGAVIADQFHRMPNLIAKEEVKEPKYTTLEYGLPARASLQGDDGLNWQEIPITEFRTHVYTYRIVHKQTPAGGDALDEFRTDAHDQPVDDSAHNPQRPSSVGYATMWLFFFPGNLQESHFRYLGKQKIGDRETYVLAFAQIPGQEGLRVVVNSSYGRCTTPTQGVAWIDQSTFQIVRMQTDLLTPLPGIQLNQLRSKLNYGAVKIRERNLSLWLPREVEITWQAGNGAGDEFHTYSHYRLFQSTARILPADKTPSP